LWPAILRFALTAATIITGATLALAQNFQIQTPLILQQQSRLVTFQGGGLLFLDATAPDRYNLGLNAVIGPYTNAQSQQWLVVHQGNGIYTIQQRSSGQFLDAHEIAQEDFAVVLRNRQTFGNGDNGQFWRIVDFGGGFVTIQQVSSSRFVEPYIDAAHGYQVVTRPQGSQLQEWRMIDAVN
jgi:hypothetical protein